MQPKTKQLVLTAITVVAFGGLLAAAGIAALTFQEKEALAVENAKLQATVDRQKPLSWGEYNFENHICNLHGHNDLLYTESSNSRNGTEYISVLSCHLTSGGVAKYTITYDPLANWNEVENKNPDKPT